jgi:rhodanese-related sulfurtransferase
MCLKRWRLALYVLLAVALAADTRLLAQPAPLKQKTSTKQPTSPRIGLITVSELKTNLAKSDLKPVTIIDARTQKEYDSSDLKIKGALRIRLNEVGSRLNEIPQDRDVVTYCSCPDSLSSKLFAQTLLGYGIQRVRVLRGGWKAWVKAGGQVEPK